MTAMAQALDLFVDGIGLWSPRTPGGWTEASAAIASGSLPPLPDPAPRPQAACLPANERRRAPDGVLVALDVAQQAQLASGRAARDLASVFTSAHGDLAIVEALCSTLASNPLALSPTRFHHSVHNAASGYWAIASGSRHGSSALAGFEHSFASGLLEAAALALADTTPVLLVGADTEARGAMRSVNRSRGLLGVALVLSPSPSPARSAHARWRLAVQVVAGTAPHTVPTSPLGQALADNAMADALPLFEALAQGRPATLSLPVGHASHLALEISPLP